MGAIRGPEVVQPAPRERTDPYRIAEEQSHRRRKLEVVGMVASTVALAALVAVFYSLLTR
jgi:hypothetical protein